MSEQAQELTDEARAGIAAFRNNMEALQHNFFLRGFFERRGYSDTKELTQHSLPRLPTRKPIREFDFDTKEALDKPDTAKLNDKKSLDEAGKFLEANPFGLAVIASSEAKGDDTEKLRVLTAARAKVVRDYLTENFKLDDKRIKTTGLGKNKTSETSKLTILVYAASGRSAGSSPTGS